MTEQSLLEFALLDEIVVICALAIIVLLICHKIRLPLIAGFLITGVLAGPHTLGLVEEISNVQLLAEVGIVLLLFTVGLEFSIKRILEYKRYFLLGGVLQVGLTVIAGCIVSLLLQRPFGEAIFFGFLLSMSSTAIVLRTLEEKRETQSPLGRAAIGILIFQDVIAVPMMLVIPFLGGMPFELDSSFLIFIVKSIFLIVMVFVSAIYLVPRLLDYVTSTKSRELFLLSVLTICFSVAFISNWVGLSLALGAFLAGLMVSETEYSNEAIGDIIPFKDVFTSFFFISVGMLLDLSFVFMHPLMVILMTIGVLLLKSVIAGSVGLILGLPIRLAILVGVTLSQVGEFSFVLLKSGAVYSLGTEYHSQLFLSVSLFTMAMTPLCINLGNSLIKFLHLLPLPDYWKAGLSQQNHLEVPQIQDHVIIVGYGIIGKNVVQACKQANIPYLILEMNSETVKEEKLKGEPIFFGDATHEIVLEHAHIKDARVVAIGINEAIAALQITSHVHALNPNAYVIVRSRYLMEVQPLLDAGANEVVAEEFGASIEVFSRILGHYHIEESQIDKVIKELEFTQLRRIHETVS